MLRRMKDMKLLVEFDLTVTPEGMPPYPATTQQFVNQFSGGPASVRSHPAGHHGPVESGSHLAGLREPEVIRQ
jgi:hypothetical protein